jgi:uncharacterized membrane protein
VYAKLPIVFDDDPGWVFSWRIFLWLLIPQIGLRRQVKRAEQGEVDGLLMLRQVFMSFCFSIIAIGAVLAVLYQGSKRPADPSTVPAAGLLVVGAAGLVFGRRVERPLICEDDQKLAGSYRTRFFLRMAFAQSAAMLGFVGFFLADAWWTYPIGVAIASLGFYRAAPTATHLAADQDQLRTQGCGRSLIRALRQPPPQR